ncbi:MULTISPECIES: UDP-N-acetylmuramate:L-alanyl-gamma-D-glutamyl-meso-diaminopimelate ligase [unclassified Guyparkeria]|uniref:UDP-N-acetylmuramate:L-alanyl-gamma-D-glutamyl- meso-diaminopimelate ligase n=1 Tax=unclassified Guyparkeria TaxID=2626246 RepID=UPI00073381B9|nr:MULTISPECIES: UDP-N-acetylmuramate:L-alanyl-gamma-D-glutamyl-meso-diaminopimelate ligase [unclassified Guyparkeria]KTG17149.1 UDP-N-acetylmuramate:L-alanyl-gamma-D-glutamyl-meso-diaminopimelate ligase [Guyparkeria sp. XI15]OAE86684.1 UDP-N-acetylmuramate:L-alanyl-gamma-D-glutamyl-meso-diaminopimelate ligase [Guyparkeria sp. WRN-7]
MTDHSRKLHILGIAGTFMGSLALLAREMGYEVSGRDHAIYPPMSDQLANAGIAVETDMDAPLPDDAEIIVGNVMRRDMPVIDQMLEGFHRYRSGPQWLGEEVLRDRFVLAVSGTHGKTTTTSMVAHILERVGMSPGFLIGGVPGGFGVSSRLGEAPFFVIEADEYDTAFFDKRSKFLHYRPRGLVINNLEFDHADIFENLAAIERQFAHLLRLVPGRGKVIAPLGEPAIERVLGQGVWSPVERFGEHCQAETAWCLENGEVVCEGEALGPMPASIRGDHNRHNALAALALARFAGVPAAEALAALADFGGVARRLELKGEADGVRVIDDFAHHPTAIAATLAAVREQMPAGARLVAVLDPRSNSMRAGVHAAGLAGSLAPADRVFLHAPEGLGFDPAETLDSLGDRLTVEGSVDALLEAVAGECRSGDWVVSMSNGGFGGFPVRLVEMLRSEAA